MPLFGTLPKGLHRFQKLQESRLVDYSIIFAHGQQRLQALDPVEVCSIVLLQREAVDPERRPDVPYFEESTAFCHRGDTGKGSDDAWAVTSSDLIA